MRTGRGREAGWMGRWWEGEEEEGQPADTGAETIGTDTSKVKVMSRGT